MTYREQVPDDRRDARAKLEALAAEGAEIRDEARPKKPALLARWKARRGRSSVSRKALRQLRRSCSRAAELASLWFAIPLLLVAIIMLMVLQSAQATAYIIVAWCALVLVGQVVGRVVPAGAARRELAWAKSLPFPVEGYVQALQRSPVTGTNHSSGQSTSSYLIPAVSKVTVEVEVADRMVKRTFASDLLRATVPKAALVDFESRKLNFVQTKMGCDHTCYGLRRWFHTVVDELLIPLHEGHTVQSVRMETSQHDG